MHKLSPSFVFVLILTVFSGCGNARGASSDSFEMTVTTTAERVQSSSLGIYRYSAVTVINESTDVVLVGGPKGRATKVCADNCPGTSFTAVGGNVWVESESGSVTEVVMHVVGD